MKGATTKVLFLLLPVVAGTKKYQEASLVTPVDAIREERSHSSSSLGLRWVQEFSNTQTPINKDPEEHLAESHANLRRGENDQQRRAQAQYELVGQTKSEECTIWVIESSPIDPSQHIEPDLVCEMNPIDMDGYVGLTREIKASDEQTSALKSIMEDSNAISGKTKLKHGKDVQFDKEFLFLPEGLVMKDIVHQDPFQRRLITATGTKSALVVRVIDSNGKAQPANVKLLSDNFFGTDGDPVNLRSQLAACSFGQLEIQAGAGHPIEMAPGVTEINIAIPFENNSWEVIDNAAMIELGNVLGPLPGPFDLIMFMLPPLCTNCWPWSARATLGGWWSFFLYDFVASLQVHEIGHNLGLHHSGGICTHGSELGKFNEYCDHTCQMGGPLTGDDIGRMCFNSAKSWQLGWYSGNHGMKTLDPSGGSSLFTPTVVTMVGVAEYDRRTDPPNQPVTVKLETGTGADWFIGFNRATGPNADNDEYDDMVTLVNVSGGDGLYTSRSYLQATMDADSIHYIANYAGTQEDLKVSVHHIDIDSTPPAIATICVTYQDDGLCCTDDDELVNPNTVPLCSCQGNCENDDDCVRELICHTQHGDEDVPGCSPSSSGITGSSYCIYPPFTSDDVLYLNPIGDGFWGNAINIVGISEFNQRTDPPNQPVIVRLSTGIASFDLAIQFNRVTFPSTYNNEYDNKVTVVYAEEDELRWRFSPSYFNAILGEGDIYTINNFANLGKDLVITVVRIDIDSPPPAMATICIEYDSMRYCCLGDDDLVQHPMRIPRTPLCDCEGHCENDRECFPNYQCYTRDAKEDVPGCSPDGIPGNNYCTPRPNEWDVLTLDPSAGSSSFMPNIVTMGSVAEWYPGPDLPVILRLTTGTDEDWFIGLYRTDLADTKVTLVTAAHDELRWKWPQSSWMATLRADETYTIADFAGIGEDLKITIHRIDIDAEQGANNRPPTEATICITYQENGLCCVGGVDLVNPNTFPLCECQGDCDNDNDCVGDLVCYTREDDNSIDELPGCTGEGKPGSDYCTDRPSNDYLALKGNTGLPTSAYPLGLCEGDCDNTSDCAPGYVCFKRRGFTKVPCCDGLGARGKDYCIHQDYQDQCNE